MYDTKKQGYERSKRLRNKKINQGSCIQTVSDKRLQHGSPEGDRKKSEFIKRMYVISLSKQARTVYDVIDFYIFHKQDAKNKFKDISHTSLLEFIDYYIKKVEETMNAMRIYLIEKEKTNITRAYLNLILQAEYFYPGFNEAFNEITNKEIKLWERIFVKAVETKEIRSDVNPSTLALTFRILLFGKCFQDALVNGLRIEELKVVLYNQYELIKN